MTAPALLLSKYTGCCVSFSLSDLLRLISHFLCDTPYAAVRRLVVCFDTLAAVQDTETETPMCHFLRTDCDAITSFPS